MEIESPVLVQRLLRYINGAENGLHSRRFPHFSGIKPGHLLENVMPPCAGPATFALHTCY